MKFWNLLRWLGTAAFVGVWLLSCLSTPSTSTEPNGGNPLPHAAPAFSH